MPRIVALVPDLLVGVRIDEAARKLDADLESISDHYYLETILKREPTDVLIVDLGVPGLDLNAIVATAHAHRVPILAFGPHVDFALLQAAEDAGVDNVYPRSAFLKDLPNILKERMSNSG